MTPITFNGYGIGAGNQTIIMERITNWFLIDFNGNRGTEIILDTGKSVRVGVYPSDVENAINLIMENK